MGCFWSLYYILIKRNQPSNRVYPKRVDVNKIQDIKDKEFIMRHFSKEYVDGLYDDKIYYQRL